MGETGYLPIGKGYMLQGILCLLEWSDFLPIKNNKCIMQVSNR